MHGESAGRTAGYKTSTESMEALDLKYTHTDMRLLHGYIGAILKLLGSEYIQWVIRRPFNEISDLV